MSRDRTGAPRVTDMKVIPVAGQAGTVSADEIISWCRDNLAHFKCPKSVEFVDSLPRTTTGKVLKRELREQLSQARS